MQTSLSSLMSHHMPTLLAVAIGSMTIGIPAPAYASTQFESVPAPVRQFPQGPRFLLASRKGDIPLDPARTPLLYRRLNLSLDGVPTREALKTIAKQAGLELMYSDELLPSGGRVSLRAEGITVAAALTDILLGAGVDVVFTNRGSAALVKRSAVAPPQTGTITGRVIDSKTKRPIQGARVTIEGSNVSAITDEAGEYRLTQAPEGTHTLIVRRLGYGRAAQSLSLSTDQTLQVDVALEQSANVLDQVVVTGTVVSTEQRALPTPITVITAEDIQAKGVTNISELFRGSIPGVIASLQGARTQDAAGMNLIVRGMSLLDPGGKPNSIKTYVDGVEIAEPRFVADIDPSIIDRIEILRGPEASTVYGSGAMNGVMQIFTKKGTLGAQRARLNGTLAAGGINAPSADGLKPQSLVSAFLQGGGPTFSYNVGGTQEYTGPWIPEYRRYDRSLQGGVRLTQGPLSFDASGRVGFLNYRTPFLARSRDRILSGQYRYSSASALPLRSATERDQQTIGTTVVYSRSPSLQASLTVGQDGLSEELVNRAKFATPADTNNFVRVTNQRRTSIAASATGSRELASINAQLTLGADRWWYNDAISSASASATIVGSLTGAAQVSRNRYDNAGYFAQTLIGIRDMVFVTAGIRAEDNPNFGGDHGLDYSPRVGLSFVRGVGGATLKLRASTGRSIRPPAPGLKVGSASATTIVLPNSDIGPERQRGFDTGGELYFGQSTSLQATYYDHTVDGMITLTYVSVPGVTPTIFQFRNVGRVKNKGWEFQGAARLAPWITAQAAYSIFDSRVLRLDPNYSLTTVFPAYKAGDRLVAVPRNTGAVSLTYALRRSTATITASRTGPLFGYNSGPTTDASNDRLLPRTPTFPDEYVTNFDPFVRYDLNASQRLSNRITGFVRIENLFNNLSTDFNNANDLYGRSTWIGIHLN